MTVVYLAGIGNSEPDHWQQRWRRSHSDAVWVEHRDWDNPDCAEWVSDLEHTLAAIDRPVLIVAHSLGCLAVAEWAARRQSALVRGAFLVAVPDVQGPCFPASAHGFRPAFDYRFGLPAWIVASTTDRYASIGYARELADFWQKPLIDIGDKGHINLASNLGDWPEGRELFRQFTSSVTQTPLAV